MIRKLTYTLSLALFVCLAEAQQINFQSFINFIPDTEASTVHCFAQDVQGLIWIGTNKGLYSYDGYSSLQHFTPGEQNNTLIHCILNLDHQRLLLGTDNGILIYNYFTDQYEKNAVNFPMNVRAMVLNSPTLWIGSLDGLFRYNLETELLENMSEKENNGLPNHTIYSLILSTDNTLYVGTYDGFCKYDKNAGQFETINVPVGEIRNNQFVNSLLEDSWRNIWIGTEGALYKYTPEHNLIEEISLFNGNSIKSLTTDGYQNLVLATDNGLYLYNTQTTESLHLVHDSRNDKSLTNNIIWGAFTDRDKNLWLATDYGISYSLFNQSLQVIPISQITGIGDGNRFYSIFKDSRDNFWFGGTNGLILSPSLTNRTDNAIWYRMGDKKYPVSHNRIRHIYEDKTQNLWIATDGSINRFDYTKKQFIRYNILDSTQTLNSNWAYHMFEDNRQQLWIATCLGGIFVVDKEKLLNSSGNYIADKNYSTANGLPGNYINQILPDPHENVWILLYNNGIYKINTQNDSISKIPVEHITGNENPNYIICDAEGFIWAGFRGGIVRINTENNDLTFIKLNTFNNSEVLSMSELEEHICVSTTEGVWLLDKKEQTAQRLNIPNRAFTCSYYDKISHKIYMGGVDEFALLSPTLPAETPNDHPVILTALYINDKLYTPETNDTKESIRYKKELVLNHNQNNLTFEFSDLGYASEDVNKFIYKLDKDKEWNVVKQNTNRITYTNLEYGNYNLIISKLDASGQASSKGFTITFHINPPWYYTNWAKVIYLLLLIGLIIWIINFFRVKQNLRIERIEKEKTVELTNTKIDFFTNVSHEFKTPLSLIIAPLSKLLLEIKDPVKKKQLENIQRNALKIHSLIRQVLDFNRMENHANSTLLLSKVEFIEFARSLFSVYEEGYKEKGLEFSFVSAHKKIYTTIDVLKIEVVLNNLVSNACKYTQAGGKIELRIELKEEKKLLNITVSDTGIGIPLKDKSYIFERYYQSSKTAKDQEGTGIGLYLVKNYTEQHGGKVTLLSEEDKGTSISVSIPLTVETIENITGEETPPEKDLEKPLILVVDDNPEIADFISQLVTRKYRYEIAHNGKMGLEMAQSLQPDLIIADIMMPVMDGLEMSRRIRKNKQISTIPIILLTAKDDKKTELKSINLNVEAFIPKPFDPDLLLSRVEQLLKSKSQLEEKARLEALNTPKPIQAISPDEKFLSEIIGIIEEKIADPDLNVNALSTISGIGSKQIYRKIKQLTGMSPVEYIRSIRIKKAAMLLTQNKFTIAEVMYMVGFSSHSYFAKCFHAEFGKTPRQFIDNNN